MKITTYLFAVFLLVSCNSSGEKIENKGKTAKTIEEAKLTVVEEPRSSESEEIIQVQTDNDFEILLPTQYRDWENKNEVDILSKDWSELYFKKGKYFLGKANYTIERGYSECSGDSTKIIHTKTKTILLIGNSSLKLGEINSFNIKKNKIWPTEKLTFTFENIEYTLRAEGKIISSERVHTDDGEEMYQKVEDYKLYISSKDAIETLFLEQASFNDTFVEILFIGDLDRDGKADFIFGTNRDYEEERVVLYLSSKADEGKLIKKVSEVAVQFDC